MEIITNPWLINILSIIVQIASISGILIFIFKKYLGNQFKKAIENYKSEIKKENDIIFSKWKLKREACLEALSVIDGYYSYNQGSATRQDFTIREVRRAHNVLAITCENTEVLEVYKGIFGFGDDKGTKKTIVDLRKSVRKELGYGDYVEPGIENTAYISKIQGAKAN